MAFWVPFTASVLAALVALGGLAVDTALQDIKVREADKPLAIHLHVTLEIIIDGHGVTIPAFVGIDPGLYKSNELDRYGINDPKTYPLHTHDTSGIIHVESTVPRAFTVGQFFDVWGVEFSKDCVLDKCGTVRMYVDGKESNEFGEHMLGDGESITITYSSPEERSA